MMCNEVGPNGNWCMEVIVNVVQVYVLSSLLPSSLILREMLIGSTTKQSVHYLNTTPHPYGKIPHREKGTIWQKPKSQNIRIKYQGIEKLYVTPYKKWWRADE
jgi:hypothetical protein